MTPLPPACESKCTESAGLIEYGQRVGDSESIQWKKHDNWNEDVNSNESSRGRCYVPSIYDQNKAGQWQSSGRRNQVSGVQITIESLISQTSVLKTGLGHK